MSLDNLNVVNISDIMPPTKEESVSSTSAAELQLEDIVDDWNTASYPSAPPCVIDLPEVKTLSSEFFYNYYVRDERTVFNWCSNSN